ncbi:MAG: hypothetical protein JZU53_11075 [Paludibacter sp.]|nr:hypothetical protein [Paludibacter sp.]
MKKKNLFTTLFIVGALLLSFSSCKDDENVTASAASLTATAGDEAQASTINDQILSEVDTYVSANAQLVKPMFTGAVTSVPLITIENTGTTATSILKKITIDFGTTGFTGRHGNTLKGKIIVNLDLRLLSLGVGSSRTITYDNFTINNISVTGTNKIIFGGWTTDKHPFWSITGENVITLADGKTITWKAERRLEFTSALTTFWGEGYILTGSASGINAEGKAYSITINAGNPLIGSTLYPYVTKGSVSVTIGQSTGVIDYGDGTQDNKATLTYSGVTYDFTIR